jgi:hypothetical protein
VLFSILSVDSESSAEVYRRVEKNSVIDMVALSAILRL